MRLGTVLTAGLSALSLVSASEALKSHSKTKSCKGKSCQKTATQHEFIENEEGKLAVRCFKGIANSIQLSKPAPSMPSVEATAMVSPQLPAPTPSQALSITLSPNL